MHRQSSTTTKGLLFMPIYEGERRFRLMWDNCLKKQNDYEEQDLESKEQKNAEKRVFHHLSDMQNDVRQILFNS